MNELNLITVRHADGREIQYVQFDKLAIGQVLNESKVSEIHYPFQTHLDTSTEYIKLDALLRELGFAEIAREQIPFDFGEGFYELSFYTYEVSTSTKWYTAYAFENIVVVANDSKMSVHTNITVNEVFYKWFGYGFDSHIESRTNIPNDAATALAFKLVDMEHKYYDKTRAPGEELDNDYHERRLRDVARMREELLTGGIVEYLNDLKNRVGMYADTDDSTALIRKIEAFLTDYLRYMSEQQQKLAELLAAFDQIQ